MALVAYDYSDESESDVEVEEHKNPTFGELFHALPTPKQVVINEVEEDCNDVILNKTGDESSKKIVKKEPVKITIPALSNYDSDEEDIPKKITKVPVKASGLFALLPSPKCVPVEKSTKFDASVAKEKNLVPRAVKSNIQKPKRQNNSDDENDFESNNYFSIEEKKVAPVTISSTINISVDSAKPVKNTSGKTNQYFADLVAKPQHPAENTEEGEEILTENAMKELCGKRHKRARTDEEVNVIDINATDIMPDPREWRTKALTEETPTSAVKKGDEPSLQSRRKHQITYLAYQAKVNEQELKNQWALNRMTRKQTQAKYGF